MEYTQNYLQVAIIEKPKRKLLAQHDMKDEIHYKLFKVSF